MAICREIFHMIHNYFAAVLLAYNKLLGVFSLSYIGMRAILFNDAEQFE